MPNDEVQVAYLHGRIEAEIERFASSMGISPLELTERLVELLLPPGKRAGNRLPVLQSNSPARRSPVAKVEVAVEPHGRRPQNREVGATSAIKKYWQKMTREQRSAEVRRRMKKWSPEAKKKWRKT
jgi:hypothetical protein